VSHYQPGILAPVPGTARYLSFALRPDSDPTEALEALRDRGVDDTLVVGLGQSLVLAMGASIDGLRGFPALSGPGFEIPATPGALWCWLRGEDRGALVHAARGLTHTLSGAFRLDAVVDAFRYGAGLDLSGYEDGTENPQGEEAVRAALLSGMGAGLDGSSFVAVQQWVHDLDDLAAMSPGEQDHVIGRRRSDNEELDDAPPSAHVKRTAQESFDPEAFVVRRSMPWSDASGEGLVFVAFGETLDAFEVQLRRMVGLDDGVTDALFRFTRPVTGNYFWCPPVRDGRLDLSALGL